MIETELILGILILFSVLIQGGYFPTIFLASAVILTFFFLLSGKKQPALYEWFLWALSGIYLLTSLCHGYRSDSLGQACLPGACAAFLSVYSSLPERKKKKLLTILTAGNGIFAGMAILAFCGLLPLTGAVASHRLQFTFQYANAAGSWFAAMVFLTQDHKNDSIRKLTLPSIVTLLLTRSVGALGLYAVLQSFRLYKRRNDKLWQDFLLIHGAAALFAVVFYNASGWIVLQLLGLLYTTGWYMDRLLPHAKEFRLHWLCLVLALTGVVLLPFTRRVTSSAGTLLERVIQIQDGISIIGTNTLSGVGARNWGELYPYYQSAQYTSSVVHSSVVQAGVDAGIFAVMLVCLLAVLAIRKKRRGLPETLAGTLLLIHSLLDFTMQFFPIVALSLSALFAGDEPAPERKGWRSKVRTGIVLCFGLICVGLFACEMQYKQLVRYGQREDWATVVTYYETRLPAFGQSQPARNIYIRALYHMGDFTGVTETAGDAENLSLEELRLCASAKRYLGDEAAALDMLLSRLEKQLYRVQLFEMAAELLRDWDAGGESIARYNAVVNRANENQSLLGTLKGDQVYIEHFS